jgi:hypothetical protein
MDDDDLIPVELLRDMHSNPFKLALANAYAQRLIARAKEQAEFWASNPSLWRDSTDEQN